MIILSSADVSNLDDKEFVKKEELEMNCFIHVLEFFYRVYSFNVLCKRFINVYLE